VLARLKEKKILSKLQDGGAATGWGCLYYPDNPIKKNKKEKKTPPS
jgi:hypothetical protein